MSRIRNERGIVLRPKRHERAARLGRTACGTDFLSGTKIKLANIKNIYSKLIIKLAKEVNDLAK